MTKATVTRSYLALALEEVWTPDASAAFGGPWELAERLEKAIRASRRRPRTEGKRRVWLNVCMSEELREQIDEASDRAGMAAGAWVRELIEDTFALEEEDL